MKGKKPTIYVNKNEEVPRKKYYAKISHTDCVFWNIELDQCTHSYNGIWTACAFQQDRNTTRTRDIVEWNACLC